MAKKAINITLEEETIDRLDQLAGHELRSRSNMIEVMVEEWERMLKQQEEKRVREIMRMHQGK